MTEPATERSCPGPYFPKGRPLAESFDGEVCGSRETFSGDPCELPARYGRSDVEDPTETLCHRHADDVERCGHPTLHGGPCLVPAGHGTDAKGGVCHFHAEAAQDGKRTLQAEFLGHLARELTVSKAAERTGVGTVTVYLWARQYADFGKAMRRLLDGHVSDRRLELVEETLFERTSDDRASAAERIFMLVNASSGGDGWRDVKFVKHDHQHSGGVLLAPATPSEEDWASAAEEQQRRLREETGSSYTARLVEAPSGEAST